MRQWKIRLNPAHLRLRQPDQITNDGASLPAIESTNRYLRNQFKLT